MAKWLVNIEADIKEAERLIGDLAGKVIYNASKRAINKTAKLTQRRAAGSIGRILALKKGQLTKMIPIRPAKGKTTNALRAVITPIGTNLPLILFVKGSKTPENQKGKKVSSRRKLRVEIRRGSSEERPRYFIQKSKFKHRLAGEYGVFQRTGRDRGRWKHQSVPGVTPHFLNIEDSLSSYAQKTVSERFVMEIRRLYLDRLRKTL